MKLFVVGLPIGNIKDISFRAVETIQNSDCVICEDTRMFHNLWTKLVSLGMASEYVGKVKFVNDFNEEKVLPKIMDDIVSYERVILVSDAGMPLISDPGYKLVNEVLKIDGEVEVVPGPTAVSSALAISGLPTDKFQFVGFLPKKLGKRTELLKSVLSETNMVKTVVIYESPYRLSKLLEEISLLSDFDVCVGIDLTKSSEKVFRGKVSTAIEYFGEKTIKGEVVLVVNGQ